MLFAVMYVVFVKFLENHHRIVVPLHEAFEKVFHKRPILLVRSIWVQKLVERPSSAVLSYILLRKGRLS